MSSKKFYNRTSGVGKRLKEVRKKLGITQGSLAETLLIPSVSTISEIENDKREISDTALELLSLKTPEASIKYITIGEGPLLVNGPTLSENATIQDKLEKAKTVLTSGTRHAETLSSNIEDSFRLVEMDQKEELQTGGTNKLAS